MSAETDDRERFDVVAVGAHPDDVEIVMGGTMATLTARGLRVLIVDLCDGEPTRYAPHGARREQAAGAAALLGASRTMLDFHDRLLEDTPATRSVFCGPQAARLERFRIEDQYVGSLVGVEYAEAFKARSPFLIADPTAFVKAPFG